MEKILRASFPGGSDGKESACNAEKLASIPGWGRAPGEGNGSAFYYSGLENPVDRGGWQATVHGVTKELDRTEQLTLSLSSKISRAPGILPTVGIASCKPFELSGPLFWLTSYLGVCLSLLLCKMGMITATEL